METESELTDEEASLERFLEAELEGRSFKTLGVADEKMWALAKERLDIDDYLLFPPIQEVKVDDHPVTLRRTFPTNVESVYFQVHIQNTSEGWRPSAKQLIKMGPVVNKEFQEEINK